jgi:hypothetical protein
VNEEKGDRYDSQYPLLITVDEKFQMKNEKHGGDWKIMKTGDSTEEKK